MRRDLRDRLERLERRMPPPPDLPRSEEREGAHEISLLHFDAWLKGGTLEDVPEQHRDAEMWAWEEKYGPVLLWMVEEGFLGGGEELPEVGAGLDPADGYPDDVDRRPDPPDGDAEDKLP